MGARFTSTLSSKFVPKTIKELKSAALGMATDIHRRAVMIAPKDTRALVNSGHIVPLSTASYRVIFGSDQVQYAKMRHYVNNKNPQTIRYLQRAGDSVKKEHIKRYLKQDRLAASIGQSALTSGM